MFGWRKKHDGFIWNEYVRTTVLVRRDQRRQKIEDVKVAAVDGLKQAGRQGVAMSAAGAKSAGRGLWAALKTAGYTLYDGTFATLTATGFWIVDRSRRAWHVSTPTLARLSVMLRSSSVAAPLLVVSGIATLTAAARWSERGFDLHATIATIISVLAITLYVGPRLLDTKRLATLAGLLPHQIPLVGSLRPEIVSAASVGLGLVALFGAGSVLLNVASVPGSTTSSSQVAKSASTPVGGRIDGRAVVLSGDRLKIGPTLVQLAGIEAPLAEQVCTSPGTRTWGCGASAKSALQKLVAGKQITCDLSAKANNGATSATCQVAGADIAGQLVRGGHVFSETGFFATYSRAESEAKSSKVGIWRDGDAQRPSAYLARLWDEAVRAAPGGCPIKGVISGDSRTYVMPGTTSYDKAKIRANRGERWFCTEDEAQTAGFKPASAS
jgi:endonuclease YncB( thermonuclease family)